jgi:hypothetical protein
METSIITVERASCDSRARPGGCSSATGEDLIYPGNVILAEVGRLVQTKKTGKGLELSLCFGVERGLLHYVVTTPHVAGTPQFMT